jgi:hypothetical protein
VFISEVHSKRLKLEIKLVNLSLSFKIVEKKGIFKKIAGPDDVEEYFDKEV